MARWVKSWAGRGYAFDPAVTLHRDMANVSTKNIFPGGSYPGGRIISVILAILAEIVALSWTRGRMGWFSTAFTFADFQLAQLQLPVPC